MAPILEERLSHFFTLLANSTTLLGPGDVLEAGANDGRAAGMLSGLFWPRKVLAVEPLIVNIESAQRVAKQHVNMEVLRAGLGEIDGKSSYGSNAEQGKAGDLSQTGRYSVLQERELQSTHWISFDIFAIDTLFRTRTLAVAHLDLEGWEEAALRGARRTLLRDRPLLTVESFPHSQPLVHRNLSRIIRELGYTMHVITNAATRESCGWPRDCHNYICVPRERAEAFEALLATMSQPPRQHQQSHASGHHETGHRIPAYHVAPDNLGAARSQIRSLGRDMEQARARGAAWEHARAQAHRMALLSLPSMMARPHLLITFITRELTELAKNWLCAAGMHVDFAATAVVIVAMEAGLCAPLREWLSFTTHGDFARSARMNATCIEAPRHPQGGPWTEGIGHSSVVSDSESRKARSGTTVYGSARYTAATHRKLELLVASGRAAEMQGVERMLYLDADTVLHREPFGVLAAQEDAQRAYGRKPGLLFDRALAKSPCAPPGIGPYAAPFDAGELNTGVISIRPTSVTVGVLTRALANLYANRTYSDFTDLGPFQHVYAHSANARPRMGLLPCPLFAGGKELPQMQVRRDRMHVRDNAAALVLYHANWILNSDVKRQCLDASGQWLVRALPTRCATFNPQKRVVVHRHTKRSDIVESCHESSVLHHMARFRRK